MKKIEAIIPHSRMDSIFQALEKKGINFTYYDVRGRGQIPTQVVEYGRGTGTFREEFNTNALLMTIVNDSMKEMVIDTISNSGGDGSSNSGLPTVVGKIFVSEVNDAIDIGSKSKGEAVL
jgi:nitrogen regulatory protein PII